MDKPVDVLMNRASSLYRSNLDSDLDGAALAKAGQLVQMPPATSSLRLGHAGMLVKGSGHSPFAQRSRASVGPTNLRHQQSLTNLQNQRSFGLRAQPLGKMPLVRAEAEGAAAPAAGEVKPVMIFDVELNAGDCQQVQFERGRTPDGERVWFAKRVLPLSVPERKGVKEGDIIVRMQGGAGPPGEMWGPEKLASVSYGQFDDKLALALRPVTFDLLRGKPVEEVEDDDDDEEEADFPIIPALLGFTFIPPFVILALNSVFHWYDIAPQEY